MIDAKATLAASGHNPNKALGQNFLADASALEAIVDGFAKKRIAASF